MQNGQKEVKVKRCYQKCESANAHTYLKDFLKKIKLNK